jgi:hypothetical protein
MLQCGSMTIPWYTKKIQKGWWLLANWWFKWEKRRRKKKLNHVLTTKQLRPNPTLKSTVIHLPPIDFTCRAGKLESLEKIPWLKYGFEPRIQHK